ncbi:MAG: hypothetical protein AAF517_10210 [Planctomycetota bacterium]
MMSAAGFRSIAVFLLALCLSASSLRAANFIRADANVDNNVDLSDGVAILNSLFLGLEPPPCRKTLDANDDGKVDISDGIYVLSFLFLGGTPIPEPYPECGEDPTEDDLDCEEFDVCPQFECFTNDDFTELLQTEVARITCVPTDAVEQEALGLLITVCPAEEAPQSCGPARDPGCPVVVEELDGEVIPAQRQAVVFTAGVIEDFPVTVENALGTVVCSNDITFTFDAVIPFQTRRVSDTVQEVTSISDLRVENPVIEMDSSGGVLCSLLEANLDLFEEQIITELENATGELLVTLNERFIGLYICDE